MSVSTFSFAEVSVIVNSSNPDAIDTKLIKKLFLGKAKSFPSVGKAAIFSLKGESKDTVDFRQKALKKSNSQYKSYWSKLAFTGKGTPPKELGSDNELLNAVKSNPNAIGFISSANVTADVKVVATF